MKEENRKTETAPRGRRRLYDGIILAGLVLLAVAGIGAYRRVSDRRESARLYEEMKDRYVSAGTSGSREEPSEPPVTEPGTDGESAAESGTAAGSEPETESEPVTEAEVPWNQMIEVDFSGLHEINPDIVGWLYFENEEISYPVMYAQDNMTYFHTTPDGEASSSGSIYLDSANHPDFEDSHSVIYGHNMKNLTMFGRLKYYRQDRQYYEDHQYFQIHTEEGIYRYRIFSWFGGDESETELCRVDFNPDNDFPAYLEVLLARSERDCGIEVGRYDKVITLVTCYTTGKRTFVSAVRTDSVARDSAARDSDACD